MKREHINCNLCGSDDWKLVYKARDNIWLIGGDFDVVKCNRCSLVCVNPRPVMEEMHKFYPPKYYTRAFGTTEMTPDYKLEIERISENRYRPFSSYKEGGKVLEIGCGEGFFMQFLKERGWQVKGVEISSYAAKHARDVLKLDIFSGSFDDFTCENKIFDIVCLFEVLEHFYNPHASLAKIRNILKDDGILVITVPNFSSFQRILFGKGWHILDIPRHIFQFTRDTLKEMLKKAGFEPLKLFSISNNAHTDITTGYSESLRYWLREHNLYPPRKIDIKPISSSIKSNNPDKSLVSLLKKMLHTAEFILFYPIAKLTDKICMGDTLYVCAQKMK